MANILLCNPIPSEHSPQKNPPLGIMFAGAAAERAGHWVEYWDQRWDSKERLLDLMRSVQVVGVSSFTGIQLKYASEILKLAKKIGKITILGGIHANLTSDQCLIEDFIDYVAIGEGEITLPSFLEFLDGVNTRPVGIKGSGVDYIPAPRLEARDFISPITDRTLRLFEVANMTNDIMLPTSRGCPYSCGFCVNSTIKDKKYRMVDIRIWSGWLDSLLQRMEIRWLQIGDDFLGNQQRILSVGNILKERKIKWHPSFRADNFNNDGLEFASKLQDLGVTDIAIGVETGSDRLMRFIDKAEKKEDIINAARCLAMVGIRPRYYLIIGFPTETIDERNETFDFADELYGIHDGNCNIVFYNFTPFPGIKLYDAAVGEGMRVPQRMCDWERFTISNSGTSEMQNVYHIAGLHFHQQPGSKTDMNFPGLRRLFIKPFEKICDLRWKYRYFKYFSLEKCLLELTLKYLKR